MKKLFILLSLIFILASCDKKIECVQELDNTTYKLTSAYETYIDGCNNSLRYGIINKETYNREVSKTTAKYEADLQEAKNDYYECLK